MERPTPIEARDAIEASDFLVEAFDESRRAELADQLVKLAFEDEQIMNQSHAGWGEFEVEIDPGTQLLLPEPGNEARVTLHPTQGSRIYTPKEHTVGRNGTGVLGWSSGAATGEGPLTEPRRRIDHSPVFEMRAYGSQRLLGLPSLFNLIGTLELNEPETARALKGITRQLEAHLKTANLNLHELAPSRVMHAPNIEKTMLQQIPTVRRSATLNKVETEQVIRPETGLLQVLGRGAKGSYLDASGSPIASVETDMHGRSWHILYPGHTISEELGGKARFVCTCEHGTHLTAKIDTNEPAVIATMNQALALAASRTAQMTWHLEGER